MRLIAAAGGKKAAILCALRTCIVDILITDERNAAYSLELAE